MTVYVIVYTGYERDFNGVFGVYSSKEAVIKGRVQLVEELSWSDVDIGEFSIEEWDVE